MEAGGGQSKRAGAARLIEWRTDRTSGRPTMSDRPEPYFKTGTRSAGGPEAAESPAARMGPLEEHQLYELAEGVSFRPVFGENLLLNFVTFGPDRGFPSHDHPEEQFGLVLEGEMELTIGTETRLLRKGDLYVIPPNVPHEGRTLQTACLVADIFSPPRAGFRELIARANRLRSPSKWWEPAEPET
jgi:quercetin dioxygenase-like cupin family protein